MHENVIDFPTQREGNYETTARARKANRKGRGNEDNAESDYCFSSDVASARVKYSYSVSYRLFVPSPRFLVSYNSG